MENKVYMFIYALIVLPVFFLLGKIGFKIGGIGGAIVGILITAGLVGAAGEETAIAVFLIILLIIAIIVGLLSALFGWGIYTLWGVGI